MRHFLWFLLLTLSMLFLNCRDKSYPTNREEASVNEVSGLESEILPRLVSQFIDSLNIGEKGQNKIELYQYQGLDSVYVDIFFSKREQNSWTRIQSYRYASSVVLGLDEEEVTVRDYNNDGFNDITCHSALAARGANDLRRLFIYSPSKKRLIYIRNSEEYANLDYNAKLKCLDAFNVYGGSTTSFLRIQADSLFQFAKVDLWGNQRTVTVINKEGQETVLLQDSIDDGPYVRYSNYKPLE